MKKLFLFSILIILLTSSCRRENNNLPEEIVWSYAIESADSEEASFIYDPIIYDNIVVIPRFSFRDNIGELIALDKVTGEVIWKWQEAHDKYDKDGFSQVSYVYDGILAIGDNNYTAGLNIYTGETIWENLDNVWGYTAINGVKDQIFKSAYILNDRFWIQKGNIYTGEWETIYEQARDSEYLLDTDAPKSFEWEGKVYLTFNETHWKPAPNHETNYFLNLYNITDDSLVWRTDTIPTNYEISHTPGILPPFTEGKLMLANEVLYAYNIKDGSLDWKKSYENSLNLSTRLQAENGRVYAHNSDGYFLCVDVHTGDEYYRTTTGGTPSTIELFENKVIMSGIGTANGSELMVLNKTNGIIEQRFTPPIESSGATSRFQFVLAVDKETGWAYTADYQNVFCYNLE